MALLFPLLSPALLFPQLCTADAPQTISLWQKAPPLSTLLFCLIAVVGLILWIFGRRMAKSACVIAGLVIGLAIGWLIAELAQAQQSLPIYLIAGSLLGGGICLMLFRLWMGIGLALVLSLTLTPALLPPPPPPLPPYPTDSLPPTPVISHSLTLKQVAHLASVDSLEKLKSSHWADRSLGMVRRQARLLRDRIESKQTALIRQSATIAASVALVGLILGLLMPQLAAAVQSAWAGSWMMLTAGRSLMAIHMPEIDLTWLDAPEHFLWAIGLITILGIIVQWSASKRKSDQKNKAASAST